MEGGGVKKVKKGSVKRKEEGKGKEETLLKKEIEKIGKR
jgi:hypothetical protein